MAYHLFISTFVYTIIPCIPNIPLYIHQYITLAYHWLIHCIPKKIPIIYYIVSPISLYIYIYIRQYITLAYHWLIHCIPKKIIITYYIVSPIYCYIYIYIIRQYITLAYHWLIHCIPKKKIIYYIVSPICRYIHIYIYTSVFHIGLPLAYTLYPQKNRNILHCIPNIPLYIYTHQYFTLAYHWLKHCIPKDPHNILHCIPNIPLYIYISISHWLTIGLYIVSPIYHYVCIYIYIHISISPRYIQSLSFFSGYQDAALIFQPSQLVLRGADDGCPGWCGMKSSGKC